MIFILIFQLHKAWLDKRAAAKANNTSEKTSYFRRVIKFKNKNEPLDNNIRFLPDFETKPNLDKIFEKKYSENDVLSSEENQTEERIEFSSTTEYQTTESIIDSTSQTTEEFIPTTEIFVSSSTSGITTTTERNNEIITTATPLYNISKLPKRKRPYFRRQHLYVKKTNNWGPWSGWSGCSRECGTGVKSQMRECFSRQ